MPKTILVVDDEAMLKNVICSTLKKAGYEVLGACNGEEAVAICNSFTGEINLLITDLVMGDINGLELVALVRRRHPAIKVVAMSGGGDTTLLEEARRTYPFLLKPFGQKPLLETVESIMQHS